MEFRQQHAAAVLFENGGQFRQERRLSRSVRPYDRHRGGRLRSNVAEVAPSGFAVEKPEAKGPRGESAAENGLPS